MHFMLQKEVVDRMVSKPNSKIYGRLSVMTQAYFTTEKLFDISENVFLPKPKVKSSFIRLLPRKSVFNNDIHEEVFSNVVRSSFEGRRKMIRKSLNNYLNDNDYNRIKPIYDKTLNSVTDKEYLDNEDKLFSENPSFSNPIGIGEIPTLILAVFAEFIAPIFIIIGYKTKFFSIFPIATMIVAGFIVHFDDPFPRKEKALLYLAGFIVIFLMGAGKYSTDKK